jgi:outer membrane receptor protein involved in Fe transport
LLLRDDSKPPDRSTTFYLIDYWKVTPSLLLELGVFGDFAKNSRQGFARPVSNNLVSPLLGVNYSINARHTLRLAVQRHLDVHDNPPLLAPADVAGFPPADQHLPRQ